MERKIILLVLFAILGFTSCESRKQDSEDNSQNSSTSTETGKTSDNESGAVDVSGAETSQDTTSIDERPTR